MITLNKNVLWEIVFYDKKVQEQVLSMPRNIRVRALRLMEIIQRQGPDLGMPHTRALGKGLFEIRAKATEGIGRIFYCTMVNQQIIILYCYVKKTQKTPERHLEIARARLNEVKK